MLHEFSRDQNITVGMTRAASVASKSYRDESMVITWDDLRVLDAEYFGVTLTIIPVDVTKKYVLEATPEQWQSIDLIVRKITEGDEDNVLKLEFRFTGMERAELTTHVNERLVRDNKPFDDEGLVKTIRIEYIEDRIHGLVQQFAVKNFIKAQETDDYMEWLMEGVN